MALPPIPPIVSNDSTSLAVADFGQTQRIDQVFLVLTNLLNILQNVAITQADSLNFFTEWQQAYNNLMSKVPVFTSASTPFGGVTTADINIRSNMNNLNSNYLEQIRSNSSIVSDDAKAMQSNISQTTDMVTQFGNMATAFLQEMSTILSAVYR